MKYTKAIDIWALSNKQRRALQPGQWVYAGVKEDKGVWLGIRANGAVGVVAWYGNAKGRKSYKGYIRSLRDYALGK